MSTKIRVAVALLVCLLAAPVARAGADLPWTLPLNLSATAAPSQGSGLAVDPVSGDVLAVWQEGSIGAEEVMVRRRPSVTGAWGPAQNLSLFPQRDTGVVVFYDRTGTGHVLWTRRYARAYGSPADGTEIMWRKWNGTAWSPPTVLWHVDSYMPGSYDLVLAETADSLLLFVVWNLGYCRTEYRGGAWAPLTDWDYTLGVHLAQVIVTADGAWHAAGYGPNSDPDSPWFYDGYYVRFNGTSWTAPVNLSATDGVADQVGMAFDGGGRLHFFWSDAGSRYSGETTRSAIWERVNEGGTWTPNTEATVYNPDQTIGGFAVAADAGGRLHLAWNEGILQGGIATGTDIYYQSGDGTAWSAERVVAATPLLSRPPALALLDGLPAVVWEDGDPPGQAWDVWWTQQLSTPLWRTYVPIVLQAP